MSPRQFLARFADRPIMAGVPRAERAGRPLAVQTGHAGTAQELRPQDADSAILAEQIRVIYLEGERLILTGVAVACILVWVLWDHIARGALLGWLAAFLAYSLARLAMSRAYRRRPAGSTDHRAWMTRAQIALAVGGGLWGASCFLLYVPDRVDYQLFLGTMLLGAVISGLAALAVYLPAYLVFITPFVVLGCIRFAMDNDALHWGIALAHIAILFIFSNFGRYIQRTFVESLRLRMELAERNHELAERNREVERANLAKSRFLAAASHDLRQPLHALNLFVGQLRDEPEPGARQRLVARIDAAVSAMNELFNALLDISKLDAGVLSSTISEFPVDHLFQRIESTFAPVAREKGLRLRVVPGVAWVRSDAILLERILLNLVSNAVRYTARGGVLVGCRRRGDVARLEVWDTGVGIAADQQHSIFSEFYQVAAPGQDRHAGMGLGLAIVDRLCQLLGHTVDLASRVGRGSRFAISVPLAAGAKAAALAVVASEAIADPAKGKLVVVIDDDALVMEGMRGLLQSWGCRVVTAESDNAAVARLGDAGEPPALIISDYRLSDGRTGFEAIERLRRAAPVPVPAFLVSGDTTTERMREARARGFTLLCKPVSPMALRATVNQLLRTGATYRLSASEPTPAPTPR